MLVPWSAEEPVAHGIRSASQGEGDAHQSQQRGGKPDPNDNAVAFHKPQGNVFPQLGIPSDEKVGAHALPKVEVCLQVMERELSHGKAHLLGSELTLADLYLLPITFRFGFAPEAQAMYPNFRPSLLGGMETLPTVKRFRAAQPPRGPIEHARKWAVSHRPKY